jgi:TonB family protein
MRALKIGALMIVILFASGFLVWKFALESGFISEFNVRRDKWISTTQATPPAITKAEAMTPSQELSQPNQEDYPARCTPKVKSKGTPPKDSGLVMQKGEKSTGYVPLVSFEILESGEVSNVQLKRSSGFANVDKYALDGIRNTKFNSREGCGVIETEATVNIDWR